MQRSQTRLRMALLELLAEHDYDAITVSAIVDRAGVGRSTFYTHFESKEDLLLSGLEGRLSTLTRQAPPGTTAEEDARRFRFSMPMLRHIREQRRFFEAAVLGGADPRLREISEGILADMIAVELERVGGAHGSREILLGRARATAGAFLALLAWWLRSADHLSAEEIDDLFHHSTLGSAVR
ncbi:MAG: helix-turn-helix domain-containing protein [Gemmatimonadota bacterium]